MSRKDEEAEAPDSPVVIGVHSRRSRRTPLHHAAAQGKAEVVKLLLDKGADVNAILPDPEAPSAIFKMNPELAKRYGLVSTTTTSARSISPQDKTAFDLATRAGHIELAQLIKDRGGKRAVDLRSSR